MSKEIKTYVEQIVILIDEICLENNLQKPITVFGAAKIITENRNIDKAIELYEGARDETKNNIFKTSAYEATLDTYLYPTKNNNNEK